MKRISILLMFLLAVCGKNFSQYIGVKAKYVDTRLVPKPGFPDTRENRLVLSFYNVDLTGAWTPISMTDHDMYVKAGAVQVAGLYAIDSTGANYPGYNFTAPVVASYYNSLGSQYFDCGTYGSVHLVANGHELDCGFLTVSEWLLDYDDNQYEQFNTIEVALPYYWYPDPLAYYPGNVNFGPATTAGAYNYYNFSCGGSLQLVNRGTMMADSTGNPVILPIHFANINATINNNCQATLHWSNLTESDISYYAIERSVDNAPFIAIDSVPPVGNTGGSFSYSYTDPDSISGYNLYRIKATETSGNSFYSIIYRVNGCRGGRIANDVFHLRIYPNPIENGRFVLNATELPKGKYEVILVSMTGQPRKISEIDHPGGAINKLFDLNWMTPGMYTLILRSAELNLTQKIIIIH